MPDPHVPPRIHRQILAIPGVFGSVHLRRLAARIRTRLAFYRGQLLLAYEGECR